MEPDLDLVRTKDLLEALKDRFDVFAMVGIVDQGENLKTEDIAYAFCGEPFACIGATSFLRAKIEANLLKQVKKENEDDED